MDSQSDSVIALADELEQTLLRQFGPLLSNELLYRSLGFPSMGAFRQALSKKRVPIAVFSIPNRNGKFALTKDVARWLAAQKALAASSPVLPNE